MRFLATGPELRKLREAAGISRAQAAKIAGVSMPTLDRYETGNPIKLASRRRLEAAYAEMRENAVALRAIVGNIDAAWSQRQIEAYVRSNAVPVLYSKPGDQKTRCFLLTEAQTAELCRLHLLAAGKNV